MKLSPYQVLPDDLNGGWDVIDLRNNTVVAKHYTRREARKLKWDLDHARGDENANAVAASR